LIRKVITAFLPALRTARGRIVQDPEDMLRLVRVDVFRMDTDGRAVEHWDVLQTVGARDNSAPWFAPNLPRENPNGMF
jgi:hypothetical protein